MEHPGNVLLVSALSVGSWDTQSLNGKDGGRVALCNGAGQEYVAKLCCQTILGGWSDKIFPLQTNPQCSFKIFLQDKDTGAQGGTLSLSLNNSSSFAQ